jgi:class 3 adenylate cyclase
MRSPRDEDPIELLVVDDEPDAQALFELRFRRELRGGAIALRFASSGAEALDVVAKHPELEVVVTDLNMPGMGGLELLTRLDRLHRPLKTIVLTAYGDMANIRTAMMRGAFDFQVKPIDIDDLRTTIRKASHIVRQLRAGEEARIRAADLEQRNLYLTDVFGRYVSDEVVAQLLASTDGVELTGESRELTLLVADIRGFSRLAKELTADQVVALLNGYLEVAVDKILRRGGTINEILGDGLLVFFGAPIADDAAAEHAVAAAIELQLAMAELNDHHRSIGLPELAIGIAIHSGEAVVGTVGSHQRLKYAAVGPNVNLVGRIESYARGGQVLISEATYELVQDLVSTAGRFAMRAKGAEEGLPLHVVRGIGGAYGVELPQSAEPMHPVPRGLTASIARVIDDRVGEGTACELVAVGREAARLQTRLMLAPLDNALLRVGTMELYGRVSECAVTDDGACLMTVVYNAAAGEAVDHLASPASRKATQHRHTRDDDSPASARHR